MFPIGLARKAPYTLHHGQGADHGVVCLYRFNRQVHLNAVPDSLLSNAH
jgi:hypothetical protein